VRAAGPLPAEARGLQISALDRIPDRSAENRDRKNPALQAQGRESGAMRKNLLGRTGLEISEIALGAGVTAGILINGSEVTRRQLLRRALAAGINWIDTAPTYGDGASEENIGQHLASLD